MWDAVEAFLKANPDVAEAHRAQATLAHYRHMGNKRAYSTGSRCPPTPPLRIATALCV